jgi:phosphate transport system substrate-binding protein
MTRSSVWRVVGIGPVAFVALSVLPGLAQQAKAPERIHISGSKTLQPLVESWATEFQAKHPGVRIVVEGGGTDAGFEALFAGTSQIAMAARQIAEPEMQAAAGKKMKIEEFVVARAGLSVLKNKKNPIAELDVAALRSVFSGAVDNWSKLGGPSKPIIVILRNPSSHTAEYFRHAVMGETPFTELGIVVGAQEDVVKLITSNPSAIGFSDFDRVLSHLDEVEVLRVKTPSGPSKLVFVRDLYFYAAAPLDESLKAFVDFTASPRGVEIAVLNSYFSPKDPI